MTCALLQVRALCRKHRIDILHTHSSKPGVVGRLGAYLAGVPVIIHTVHGFSFHEFMPPWKRRFFMTAERLMARFTTALLVVSKHDGRLAERFKIRAARPVDMFYYGIEYQPFEAPVDRTAVRALFGFDDSHQVFGFTGRFSEQKALHILIGAFAEIAGSFPRARLLLVGDGALRGELEELARRLGVRDRVVMTGFREDIVPVLKSMDVFVMTSFWEGLSRSLAEAMYARLPVIATDVGGTGEAVRSGETGWLIAPNSVAAAATAMTEALTDAPRAARYAEAAHAWATKTFSVEMMRREIGALYLRLYSEAREGR
jgi:glycosyltransferase involved in cell wall biosynthesis